jgi:hypothetical protein
VSLESKNVELTETDHKSQVTSHGAYVNYVCSMIMADCSAAADFRRRGTRTHSSIVQYGWFMCKSFMVSKKRRPLEVNKPLVENEGNGATSRDGVRHCSSCSHVRRRRPAWASRSGWRPCISVSVLHGVCQCVGGCRILHGGSITCIPRGCMHSLCRVDDGCHGTERLGRKRKKACGSVGRK